MSFFRNSERVLSTMLTFPKFASLESFLDTFSEMRIDAEESEFSHFYFSEIDSLRFLVLEGMTSSWDTIFASPRGVFYTPMAREDMSLDVRAYFARLVYAADREPVRPTLSPENRPSSASCESGAGRTGGAAPTAAARSSNSGESLAIACPITFLSGIR